MALGTVSITEGTGTEIGVDNINDVDYQVNKVATGDAGSLVLVSAANPMPVTTGVNVVSVSDNGGSITVDDGGGSLTVDGPLTDAQLRATAVPVSGSLTVSGTLTDAQLRATAVPVTATAVGTTAADAALTAAPVTIGGRASTASPTAVSADNDVANLWLTRRGALVTMPVPVTATLATVVADDVSVTLLAATTSRAHATLHNNSTAALYLKFGSTASLTSYSYKIPAQGSWEMPTGVVYQGIITGIWDVASGDAYVTELVL